MTPGGQRFFFLGVGGMGMLPLALFVREGGGEVSGYDDGLTPRAERILREAGVEVFDFVPEGRTFDRIIVSSAIRPDHPVLRKIVKAEDSVVVQRRGELLAELAGGRRFLAVAGSHGKTTTTALLAHLCRGRADFVIGGLPEGGLPPAENCGREWLVAEVDESDGTIEGFSPEITLFLNFDWDHADRYREPEDLRSTWRRLAERTSGVVVGPSGSMDFLLPESQSRPQRIGFDEVPDDFRLSNSNAAGAAFHAAFGEAVDEAAVAGFGGVWRRQTFHVRGEDFAVVEDYAHHPREVAAFLAWLRRQDLPHPLRVFFQPHRFSRTTRFVGEFVEALSGLEEVVLHSIYGAGETADGVHDPLQEIRAGLEGRGVRVTRADRLEDFEPLRGTFAFVGAGDANEWAPVLTAVRSAGSPLAGLAALVRSMVTSGEVRENEPLGKHTTLRVGGPAALWVSPGSVAELRGVLRVARLLGVPVEFVGNGSNLLACDEGFAGMIVHPGGKAWESVQASADESSVQIGAGVTLPGLARWAAARGLSGFEFMEGIPGSVGGGVRMNAGSMGEWIGDRVVRVEGIDASGRRVSLDRDRLSFGYRSCPELEELCIIGVVLQIIGKDSPEAIRGRMREFASRRRAAQPGGPSAGCLFRNPDGDSAGRLLDSAGLKGFGVGCVEVSSKHANFIQPSSGAKAAEVLAVMTHARDQVRERFGVELEPEVKWLGHRGMEPIFPAQPGEAGR